MKMQAPFIASNLALAQSKEKVIGWAITFWYNTQVGISIHWKKKNYMIAKCLLCATTKFELQKDDVYNKFLRNKFSTYYRSFQLNFKIF